MAKALFGYVGGPDRLRAAIKEILRAAVDSGGTSLCPHCQQRADAHGA